MVNVIFSSMLAVFVIETVLVLMPPGGTTNHSLVLFSSPLSEEFPGFICSVNPRFAAVTGPCDKQMNKQTSSKQDNFFVFKVNKVSISNKRLRPSTSFNSTSGRY
jgi:hypothetical protein